jgi:hypothetical protein
MADKELTRLDFFKEIKKDLTEAAKEFITPIVADEIDKIDDVVDEVIGVEWFFLNNAELDEGLIFEGVKDLYINKRHIAIYYDRGILQAVEKACPNCDGILNWVSNGNKFKCFNCEREYEVLTEKHNPYLKYFTIKKHDGKLAIGLYKL